MVPALICSAFSAVLLQIANMDPHRGQPLHGGHFGGDPFDRYVHLRASVRDKLMAFPEQNACAP